MLEFHTLTMSKTRPSPSNRSSRILDIENETIKKELADLVFFYEIIDSVVEAETFRVELNVPVYRQLSDTGEELEKYEKYRVSLLIPTNYPTSRPKLKVVR